MIFPIEKIIDPTPESVFTETEKNLTPDDSTVVHVEIVDNSDINKEVLPRGSISQDPLDTRRKESFEILSPRVNVDNILKIENQVEIPNEEIVQEVDDIFENNCKGEVLFTVIFR